MCYVDEDADVRERRAELADYGFECARERCGASRPRPKRRAARPRDFKTTKVLYSRRRRLVIDSSSNPTRTRELSARFVPPFVYVVVGSFVLVTSASPMAARSAVFLREASLFRRERRSPRRALEHVLNRRQLAPLVERSLQVLTQRRRLLPRRRAAARAASSFSPISRSRLAGVRVCSTSAMRSTR